MGRYESRQRAVDRFFTGPIPVQFHILVLTRPLTIYEVPLNFHDDSKINKNGLWVGRASFLG